MSFLLFKFDHVLDIVAFCSSNFGRVSEPFKDEK